MKNKNIIQYFVLFALMGILTQCKKGEDDPFLSLRTRKGRVTGEWTLTSGSSVSTNSGGSSTTYNYTESSYTRNTVNGAVTTNTSGIYSMKITFERDGNFTMTETQGTGTSTLKGIWNFTAGVGKEYKNKEQITLTVRSYSDSSPNSSSSGSATGKDIDQTWTIKELRNKKMVLTEESTSASGNSSSTYKSETVLER